MKYLLICAITWLPMIANAQTKADYEGAIKKFQRYYNADRADSINMMFSDSWKSFDSAANARHANEPGYKPHVMWDIEENKGLKEKYGEMRSFRYLCQDKDDKDLALFKVVFSKETFMMSCTLDKVNKFGTFRFHTSSPYYKKLLTKNK